MKKKLNQLLILLILTIAFFQKASASENRYLIALSEFKTSLEVQVLDIFLPRLLKKIDSQIDPDDRKKIIETTTDFVIEVNSRIDEMSRDYKAQFIDQNADAETKQRYRQSEVSVKWALEKTLISMADVLVDVKPNLRYGSLIKFESDLRNLTEILRAHKNIQPRLADELYQRFPSKLGRVKALCSIVSGLCRQKEIQETLRAIPFAGIVKKGTEFDLSQVKPLNLPENSSVVLIMNHDNTIADQKMMQVIADKMGLTNNLLVTTLIAWPDTNMIPAKNYFFEREKQAVFIEDPQISQKVMSRLAANSNSIPSVTYFPEGDQPFWSTNFPVSAKFGGFAAARKAAVNLAESGRQIYIVKVTMNFWEQTTTSEKSLKIKVSSPELVPSTPFKGSDAWVNAQRESFENEVNAERGIRLIDLNHPMKSEQGLWQSNSIHSIISCRQLLF